MIPFQGRVPGRQYVKNKPNPVEVKLFVRCGRSDMAYDFKFYQGKGTGVSKDHKDLGLGGIDCYAPHWKPSREGKF